MVIKKAINKIRIFFIKIKYKLYYGKLCKIKNNTVFRKRFEINISNSNSKISIGSGCFFNNDCSLNCRKNIIIGDNCIFGENVKIYDHNHQFNDKFKLIKKQSYSCKSVIIGDNCWIGSNVVILEGTSIGEGCIIGAGTILQGEIPKQTIVTSNRELKLKARK